MIQIFHHGATQGVTGSCHELVYTQSKSVLIDCGIFQGDDYSSHGRNSANADKLEIDFSLDKVQALLVTHTHIDHIGRIPYLFAAGFKGKIYCTQATAKLLPLMLEDALKIGFTRNARLIARVLKKINAHIVAQPYKKWLQLDENLTINFQPAGHILGSAYIECDIKQGDPKQDINRKPKRVIFSGDLGAPHAPLLASPSSPARCDTLVLECTYGDKSHRGRQYRRQKLKAIIERCVKDKGAVLIPAFSLGRSQELLYEFEQIIYEYGQTQKEWQGVEIIIDSPLAQKFTQIYRDLKDLWDQEAKQKVDSGRHPLKFEQLLTINDNEDHLRTVAYLRKTARPVIVIAASGMCSGGRIVNYLKALIEDKRTDIIFSGYQARGTTGRAIQKYGNKREYKHGWVEMDHKRYKINAQIHAISGYSAHAGQNDLINFVKHIKDKPKKIRLIHGDEAAKKILKQQLRNVSPRSVFTIPDR
jgi:metallo-beta-lactamase family protein